MDRNRRLLRRRLWAAPRDDMTADRARVEFTWLSSMALQTMQLWLRGGRGYRTL